MIRTVNQFFMLKIGPNPSFRQFLSGTVCRNVTKNVLSFEGDLMTTASWIREFVTSHPEYKEDSIVSERINYDLVSTVDKITKGLLHPPELFS